MRTLNDDEMDAVAGGQGHTVAAKAELPVKTKARNQPLGRLHGGLMACLLALTAHADAGTNATTDAAAADATNEHSSPQRGKATSLPVLGSFRQQGKRDLAMLTHYGKKGRGEYYGVLVFPEAGSGQPAKVVKTFIDTGPNPPGLSLVKPGSYTPVCHNGGPCTPVNISNEAISLCFGEASCEIIYFNGGAFRELFVTD